ncbi:MAG: SDR family oxidoreductase [Actinomycetota bacterium]|nr:SDR family oxidoreductase [Actinomycetota bacterium]
MPILALVTGGNRGLGLATARALAEHGAHVIIGARRDDAGRQAVATLRDAGLSAEHIVLDVGDPASVRAAAHHVGCRHGRLDVLVNNAGILPEATAATTEVVDAALFRQTFETNLFGAVSVIEALLPLLRSGDQPRIVNVSSTMGSLSDQTDPASPYYGTVVPAYQASKAALNSLTIGLAKQLVDTDIVVTSVCPGFVQTDLAPAAREHAPLTADEAARVVVDAALAAPGAPSGRFLSAVGAVAW